jgi:putative ABC transport system permease protein
MTTTLLERPSVQDKGNGGTAARRAIVRWAWRLFRQEWRRQILILALLIVAVAATTVGLGVVSNANRLKADPTFGTANTILSLAGSDPDLAADLAAVRTHFGPADVVSHQSVSVPGSVLNVDLRAENPNGLFVHVTLRLDAGRWPAGPDQVAMTSGVAKTLGLHVGGTWTEGGRTLRVVGLVENPLSLADEFALVAPGAPSRAATITILANTTRQGLQSFRFPSGTGLEIDSRGVDNQAANEAIVLVLGSLALLFVGLMGVAGFTVMAQRRLRALGLLGSLGATDRHLRLVMLANGAAVGASAAVAGTVVGLAAWLAFVPTLESLSGHRVDRFDLPWWAIAAAMALTVVTAVGAAWWPARAVARMPVVAALTGRPPRPQPPHRFAVSGAVVLAAGLVLLAFADQHRTGFVISGTVTTTVGLLLLAPLTIRAMAGTGSHLPFSVRLAGRDLGRYQARSGAALGAITLALGIAATIAISAATTHTTPTAGNLPANELNLLLTPSGVGNPIPRLDGSQLQLLQTRVDQLASTLHAQTVLPLEQAYNPDGGIQTPPPGAGGSVAGYVTVTLAQVTVNSRGESVNGMLGLDVATPAVLDHYGITAQEIGSGTDIVSSQSDLRGLQIFDPTAGPVGPAGGRRPQPITATHPTIQTVRSLPAYTSDPSALITSHAMRSLGLVALPSGWLLQTPHALTGAQIDTARQAAAGLGLYVENRTPVQSNAPLRNWSTAAGLLLALGVLGMTVGLIRSETANDLRILAATGASSTTRRALTAATAGTLALLGAGLGTAGAYAGLLAWHRSDLTPLGHVPITNLIIIIVGLPVIAAAAGWLLAGRQPPGLAQQPLE